MKKLSVAICLFFFGLCSFAQHTLGEWYGGGIVFYVYDNGNHGLIAAREDQSAGVKWRSAPSQVASGAFRSGIGSQSNTANIIASHSQRLGNYAAKICAEYKEGGFGDWYLPSKDELNLMFLNKNVVNNLSTWYWSSTEKRVNEAWVQNMVTGGQHSYPKDNSSMRVRAIRAF